ncbi:hypothetical protein [Pseudoalteromonas sp. SG43-4]|uniref:hypothetical protein n=1 Tax=Pseudoalteromonas sp. SG43-4 TaxID=2760969 RepID=UPI00160180B7|nr:hypothetical protein [Pseudoalteromonas sp. SG43-4]MBB1429799.1 hypothetical protein [Pseudoalteromonas sp. SG43-4]
MIKLTKTEKTIQLLCGTVGSGKTTLVLEKSINLLLNGANVVIAVHSIATMEEKKEELKNLIKLHTTSDKKELLDNIYTVKSDLNSSYVSESFKAVVKEKNHNHIGKCIFVCSASLIKFNFEEMNKKKDILFIDDESNSFKTDLLASARGFEIDRILKCFKYVKSNETEHGAVFSLLKVNPAFNSAVNTDRYELLNIFNPLILKIKKCMNKGTSADIQLIALKGKVRDSYDLYLTTLLSPKIADSFASVVWIGDEVDNNLNVQLWKKSDIKFKRNIVKNHRYNFSNRDISFFSIGGSTRVGTTKFTTNDAIKNDLAAIIVKKFKNQHKNCLVSLNTKNKASTLTNKLEKHFNLNILSTITKGSNKYTENTLIICAGSNRPNDHILKLNELIYGLTTEEQLAQSEYNNYFQTAIRGSLRDTNNNSKAVIIFPDDKVAHYVQKRFKDEFNIFIEVEALCAELTSKIFNKKPGRKVRIVKKDGSSLSVNERQRLKRRRADFGKEKIKSLIDKIDGGINEFLLLNKKQTMVMLKDFDQN